MNKILRLLCCLSLFVLAMHNQASAAHGGCRINVKVSYSAKKLDGYHPTAYHVIASGIIEYYHKGSSLPTEEESYSKEENIPATSDSKAIDVAEKKTNIHASEKLEKQCADKKCRTPDEQ